MSAPSAVAVRSGGERRHPAPFRIVFAFGIVRRPVGQERVDGIAPSHRAHWSAQRSARLARSLPPLLGDRLVIREALSAPMLSKLSRDRLDQFHATNVLQRTRHEQENP